MKKLAFFMLITIMMSGIIFRIILIVKKQKNLFSRAFYLNFGHTGSTFSKSLYTWFWKKFLIFLKLRKLLQFKDFGHRKTAVLDTQMHVLVYFMHDFWKLDQKNPYAEFHDFLNNRSFAAQETKVTFGIEASETRAQKKCQILCFWTKIRYSIRKNSKFVSC